MPKGKGRPPKGVAWVHQIFDKAILREPDGMVTRKVTSVERSASESVLLNEAYKIGLGVTRMGSHYIIHKPFVTPRTLL